VCRIAPNCAAAHLAVAVRVPRFEEVDGFCGVRLELLAQLLARRRLPKDGIRHAVNCDHFCAALLQLEEQVARRLVVGCRLAAATAAVPHAELRRGSAGRHRLFSNSSEV